MTDTPNLSAALVAALTDLVSVTKGRSAKVEMKSGGSYSYSYADLGDLVEDTRPVLAEHGLVALTPVHGHDGRLACTVELVHTSGETKVFPPLPFPEGRDAQSSGSWMTYFRRYALLAALGMAATDDDGASATSAARAAPATAPAGFDPTNPATWPDPLPEKRAKQVVFYGMDQDKAKAEAAWDGLPEDERCGRAFLTDWLTGEAS